VRWNGPGRAARKTCLILAAIVASSLLGTVEARETRRLGIPRLNEDQLGESLSRFRSLHKKANFIRRPNESSDERSLKRDWLKWVDCSLEEGVTFEGHELVAEVYPTRPFGVFASFNRKRLVELTYTLSITSINALLPSLDKRYGEAFRMTYDRKGLVDSATWSDQEASLDVELVPIYDAAADRDFLRLGAGLPGSAVRVRIRFNAPPSSGP
jgi:hypothetical protein